MSAAALILPSSVFSRLTISRGVPVGAKKPNQVPDSYPGTPDSATVGSRGAAALRLALLVASVLSEDAGGAKTLTKDDLDDLFKID